MKTVKKKVNKEFWVGMAFILPGLIGFLIFVLLPVLASLGLSFTKWNFMEGFDTIKFTGFENYKQLVHDEWFINSFKNNIIFTLVTIPTLIVLGLVVANIINKHILGGGIVRIMLFIPYIASVVAACTVWMVLLQPSYGPVNQFLMALGIDNPPRWLSDTKWALPSIMVIYIWQQLGYYVIVFISGLKGIPHDVYEAAQIDGASSFKQFFCVTVPLISPTTFFLTTMGIIGSFKVFDHISVLTQGGPGSSSSVMAFYIYRAAFEQHKTGYANTLAWALFVLIFIVTIAQWKLQDKFTIE